MDEFKTNWITLNNLEKAEKLSKAELVEVRGLIQSLQKKGLSSSKIIKRLQKQFSKLSEEYQASRAYWTTIKQDDSKLIEDAAEDLDIDTYKVILSPHPCQVCIDKTNNGAKIFKQAEVQKAGYGHAPPFHPNCYCVLLPWIA